MAQEAWMSQLELNMDGDGLSRRRKPLSDKTEQVISEITAPFFPPAPPRPPEGEAPLSPPDPEQDGAGRRIRISPLARKTAGQLGVDYAALRGTGPAGRIRQADILAAARQQTADASPAGAQPPSDGGEAPSPLPRTISGTPLSRLLHPSHAAAAAPAVTVSQTIKADVTALMRFRLQLLEEGGRHYTVNDLVLKAAAKILQQHPDLLPGLGQRVDIGMAVALRQGFALPVLREADRMGLETLSLTARDLARRAREEGAEADAGRCAASFTVSNVGMFGIQQFTPPLIPPAAASLGVGAVTEELALEETGQVQKRQVMHLTLAFDSRALSAAAAAEFQLALCALMENPIRMLL